MTCRPHNIFLNARIIRPALSRALSLALIVAILTIQASATPRAISDWVKDSRTSLAFWLHASGWAGKLSGQGGDLSPQEESQADRDARVAAIKIYPENVTLKMGEREFFTATAYDSNGVAVGGVKFTWRSYIQPINKQVRMSQTGEFIPVAVGSYRLTVEGAGHSAETTVNVLSDDNCPKSNDAPTSVKEVSSRDAFSQTSSPTAPDLFGEDHGWNPDNYWSFDDPDNDRGDPPGRPLDEGVGSGNFQIVAPLLNLPGRGIDLSLNLVYNSRVWNKANSEITYDIDRDWPAPGWSLGFGRIIGMRTNGSMLVGADGTRHSFTGTVTTYPGGYINFTGKTTDGTFIDYTSSTDSTGTIIYAQAKLPNGTII